MFARNIAKNVDFVKTFGNTPTNDHTIEPHQTEKYGTPRGGNLNPINTDEASFFDFEPASRAESPYENHFSTLGASGTPWGNEVSFRPYTPPSSASFSPKSWAYSSYHQGNPSSIFTNIDPTSTHTHYGQITPPDDENDNESSLDHQLREQLEQQKLELPRDTGKGKRKRSSTTNETTNSTPPKRTRKYASRRTNHTNEPIRPEEDVKRSKFLERNRVAASKCRQKKKEWTQSLENRARELQKTNSQLRMVVDSCRQELLFLKGELLKHNECECEPIQTFIKSGANHFSDHKEDGDFFKREASPAGSMSSSRSGSNVDERSRNDFFTASPTAEPNNASLADDDCALEALLTRSLKRGLSNEGIETPVTIPAAA